MSGQNHQESINFDNHNNENSTKIINEPQHENKVQNSNHQTDKTHNQHQSVEMQTQIIQSNHQQSPIISNSSKFNDPVQQNQIQAQIMHANHQQPTNIIQPNQIKTDNLPSQSSTQLITVVQGSEVRVMPAQHTQPMSNSETLSDNRNIDDLARQFKESTHKYGLVYNNNQQVHVVNASTPINYQPQQQTGLKIESPTIQPGHQAQQIQAQFIQNNSNNQQNITKPNIISIQSGNEEIKNALLYNSNSNPNQINAPVVVTPIKLDINMSDIAKVETIPQLQHQQSIKNEENITFDDQELSNDFCSISGGMSGNPQLTTQTSTSSNKDEAVKQKNY